MAHVVVATTIDAPVDVVFDVVHDYQIRTSWDTLLVSARMANDEAPGVGAIAICASHWYLGALTFQTRYVTFTRPTVAAVTLEKPYFIFSTWSASIRHRPHGDSPQSASDVTYTLTLRCRPRWLAWALEPIAATAFRIETRRRLGALKRYVERQR